MSDAKICQKFSVKQRQDDFDIEFFEAILRRNPDFVDVLKCLGELLTKNGYVIRGLSVERRLVRLLPADPTIRYNFACSLALSHRPDDALRELDRAVELGFSDYEFIEVDRDLDSVRGRPEFRTLLRKARARFR